jgi:hypothetical protein
MLGIDVSKDTLACTCSILPHKATLEPHRSQHGSPGTAI